MNKRKKVHERDIQSEALSLLRLLGGKWFKIEKASPDGCPDIIGWYKGRNYVIEMKVPGEKPRTNQEIAMFDITINAGDQTKVTSATSVQQVIDFVRD